MIFKTIKDFWDRGKVSAANRLSITIAGCTTGILFTFKNVFETPLDKLFGSFNPLNKILSGRIPLGITSLVSAIVFVFKTHKNLHENIADKAVEEERLLKNTLRYLQTEVVRSINYPEDNLFKQQNITLENLTIQNSKDIKKRLLEIYHELPHKHDSIEKYSVSFFWALMQFVSHFSPEVLIQFFQNESLYGLNVEQGFCFKNLLFCVVFATAVYNSKQAFSEEVEKYEPSLSDLHCTLVSSFKSSTFQSIPSSYGSFSERHKVIL